MALTTTYLDLVNDVLVRLREAQVSSVSQNGYSSLIGALINDAKREINVLNRGYLQVFINDLRDVVKYDKSSSYITNSIAATENTNVVNP